MSITKDELIEVLKAQADVRRPPVGDMIVRIFTGISTAGIIALSGLIFSFNNDINALNLQQKYAAQQLQAMQDKFDRFTDQPRFTRDQYDSLASNMQARIDGNAAELSKREAWFDQIDKRLNYLESEVEKLKYKSQLK